MIEDRPETDIEFDALGLTSAHKLRGAECYCSLAKLDDLLSDEVMAPVLRSAGYEPDEFREMMKEMASKPGHALIGGISDLGNVGLEEERPDGQHRAWQSRRPSGKPDGTQARHCGHRSFAGRRRGP